MSYFANALNEYLKHNSQIDLAMAAGISQPAVSRYRRGERKPSPEIFDEIIASIPYLNDRWKLTRAYLLDATPEVFLDQIKSILDTLHYPDTLDEDAAPYSATDKHLDSALQRLKQLSETNPDYRQLILSFAAHLKP